MKKLTIRVAIISAAMMLVARVQADVFTESVAVAPSPAGVSGNISFDFAQFNPALGTLNSVELILTPTFGDFGYSVLNFSSTPQPVIFAGVANPNGALSSSIGLNAIWSSIESYQSGSFMAAPGVNNGSLPFDNFVATPSSVTVGAGGFVGSGMYGLLVGTSGVATSSGSPGSPLFYSWYGNVGGNLQVDFNYSAVPEPSTYFSGFSALGLVLITLSKKFSGHFVKVG
jgi:hypothetical protein